MAGGQQALTQERPQTGWGLSGSALKYIAVLAMLVDHLASALGLAYYSPLGSVMHFIGRMAAPLMFYFIAVGYRSTRNVNAYTLRLAAFAAISYLPFIYFQTGALPTAESWTSMNVIYTLLLGHLALRLMHEVKNVVLSWGGVFVCLVLATYGDWGYFAVVAILLFDMLRGNFRYQRAMFCLLALLVKILPPLAAALAALSSPEVFCSEVLKAVVASGMLVPMLLLGLYNGRRGNASKWFFYIFYPSHLLVLGLLKKGIVAFGQAAI